METITPLASAEQLRTQLIEQIPEAAEVQARLQPEIITDQQEFERTQFLLEPDGHITLVFRGREELPTFEDSTPTTSVVLSGAEKPRATTETDFEAWLETTAKGKVGSSPFEQALADGSERVRFVASSTPEGLVEAAIGLSRAGFAKATPEQLSQLDSLGRKIHDRQFDEEVLSFFDTVFAASAVRTENGRIIRDGAHWVQPNEQGLAEVVLMLCGDEAAAKCLAEKVKFVTQADEAGLIDEGLSRGRERPLRQPGEKLTDAEIELVASKHLIAVHTSRSAPSPTNPDGRRIQKTTAEYHQHDPFDNPRNTLHWSLNHPVVSHMYGSFEGRPFTIVTPLDGLMELNGTPTVLNGVDTYFSTNPGGEVVLPPETSVVEMHRDLDRPSIEMKPDTISIRTVGWDKEAVKHITDVYHQTYMPGKERDLAVALLAGDIEATDMLGFVQYPLTTEKELRERYAKEGLTPPEDLLEATKKAWAVQELVLTQVDARKAEINHGAATKEAIKKTLGLILEGTIDIAEHPEIQGYINEALRVIFVKKLIRAKGGRNVTSDAASAFVTDEQFNGDVAEVAIKLGLQNGLHVDQADAQFEEAFRASFQSATTIREFSEKEKKSLTARDILHSFRWSDYDPSAVWAALGRSSSPQLRRTALATGILTIARKPERLVGAI